MDLKIGYKKRNGDTSGITIRIDDEGMLWAVDPKGNACVQLPFWLQDYKSGSLVFLGVDYDDSQTT